MTDFNRSFGARTIPGSSCLIMPIREAPFNKEYGGGTFTFSILSKGNPPSFYQITQDNWRTANKLSLYKWEKEWTFFSNVDCPDIDKKCFASLALDAALASSCIITPVENEEILTEFVNASFQNTTFSLESAKRARKMA